MNPQKPTQASCVALTIFALVFIVPHGIGFYRPFGLPSFDLPRILWILFQFVGLYALALNLKGQRLMSIIEPAPLVQSIVLFVGLWGLIGSLSVGIWSTAWAFANCLTIWASAFIAIALCRDEKEWNLIVKLISILFLLLAMWAWGEWLTQRRFITWRNTWADEILQFSIEVERLYKLSIGPYPHNHYLGLMLIATSGFLLTGRHRIVASIAFAGAMLSTGFTAGYLAATTMIGLAAIRNKSWKTVLCLGGFICGVVLVMYLGGVSKPDTVGHYSHVLSSSNHLGSIANRVSNLEVALVSTWHNSPLFGLGPGVISNPERVSALIEFYNESDIGGLFQLAVEYGFLCAVMIVVLLVYYALRGILSEKPLCQGGALSIIGFLIATLSSPIMHALPIVVIICGYIERFTYSKVQLNKK